MDIALSIYKVTLKQGAMTRSVEYEAKDHLTLIAFLEKYTTMKVQTVSKVVWHDEAGIIPIDDASTYYRELKVNAQNSTVGSLYKIVLHNLKIGYSESSLVADIKNTFETFGLSIDSVLSSALKTKAR